MSLQMRWKAMFWHYAAAVGIYILNYAFNYQP